MAKDNPFDVDIMDTDAANEHLSELRREYGNFRSSEYEPLVPLSEDAIEKGKAVVLTVDKKAVSSLRNYLYRHIGKDKVEVTSTRFDEKGKQYRVVISERNNE